MCKSRIGTCSCTLIPFVAGIFNGVLLAVRQDASC